MARSLRRSDGTADLFRPTTNFGLDRLPAGIDPVDRRIVLPSTNHAQSCLRASSEMVTMHNALAEARYSLSTRAQKFLFYAISLIDKNDRDLSKMYTVHASDFAKWAGLDVCSVRRDLWDPPGKQKKLSIGRELLEEVVIIPDYFHAPRGTITELGTHWFAGIVPEVSEGACGYLDVYFNQFLAKMLVGLNEHFLQVGQVVICKLKSRFTMRLYNWIKSGAYKLTSEDNRLSVNVDVLRGIMGSDRPTTENVRKARGDTSKFVREGVVYRRNLQHFGHFREVALDVAVDEINAKTEYNVKYEVQRGGFSPGVHTIEFTVTPKQMLVLGTENLDIVTPRQGVNAGVQVSPEQPMLLPIAPHSRESNPVTKRPPATAPEAAPSGPAQAVDEALETPELADLVGQLSEEYGLSEGQAGKLEMLARQHGCTNPTECVTWLKERHRRNKDLPADRRAAYFWAAVRDGHKYGRRGAVKKVAAKPNNPTPELPVVENQTPMVDPPEEARPTLNSFFSDMKDKVKKAPVPTSVRARTAVSQAA